MIIQFWRHVLQEILDKVKQKCYTEPVILVGDDDGEVPPVPIPNTEVKLTRAQDSSLETARENRWSPTYMKPLRKKFFRGLLFFVRHFLSLAKKLPKASIFAWFFCALCYDDIEDAGWLIPFYNDVLSSDLGSAYSTLDRRKD